MKVFKSTRGTSKFCAPTRFILFFQLPRAVGLSVLACLPDAQPHTPLHAQLVDRLSAEWAVQNGWVGKSRPPAPAGRAAGAPCMRVLPSRRRATGFPQGKEAWQGIYAAWPRPCHGLALSPTIERAHAHRQHQASAGQPTLAMRSQPCVPRSDPAAQIARSNTGAMQSSSGPCSARGPAHRVTAALAASMAAVVPPVCMGSNQASKQHAPGTCLPHAWAPARSVT